MISIIWGSTPNPIASQRLAHLIEQKSGADGFFYIGYPVLSTAEGANSIDALWISPQHGIIVFHIVEGRDVENYQNAQDDFANSLETKLRSHRSLMNGRTLTAAPNVITYAPLHQDTNHDPSYPIANDENILDVVNKFVWDRPDLYETAHAVIQSISSIRKGRRRRAVALPDSRGAKLKQLEASIANLDSLQSRAVIETVDDVQRIRGLAGSGKTIILALKAAYLHAQHPEWKIAITFNTRALKGQFHKLIEMFVVEQTGEAPIWENLQIINAWGAPGSLAKTGVYYQFCVTHGIEFFDFTSARQQFGQDKEFGGVCSAALSQFSTSHKIYDVILIDEAQDFDPAFLRLCYESLGEKKRLVYAYDELQSLNDNSLPPPEDIFGRYPDGSAKVVLRPNEPGRPSQDITLEKCYRNSRPVLATAHALGFGIYREPDPKTGTGLIQMFDRSQLWEDVGYRVVGGQLEDGRQVVLSRTRDTSPDFLELDGNVDDLIQFVTFNSIQEQASWLADSVANNINVEELTHDDVIVINPNPITTIKQAGLPRKLLFERGIQSHVAGVDSSPDVFFKVDENSIAFTGVFRAKGNEAGMVYVMNAQDCYTSFGGIGRIRNRLFTAITRSKAWVRVLGVGPQMDMLRAEYERVKGNDFKLNFTYPTEEMRKYLRVVNRDLTSEEKKKIAGASLSLRSLTEGIEAGKVLLEDLPPEDIERLRLFLSGGANGHS